MLTKFNLPRKIKFCSNCLMSNQRPSSIPEFSHTIDRKGAKYLNINDNGICDACIQSINKRKIDWEKREKSLLKLLEKHRKNNGDYDCIIPGSGGKDSAFQAHVLKYKYGMNPLVITWPPILYTDYGLENYNNWIEKGGFDGMVFKPDGGVMKKLTKLSIINLLHPFQTFILGQKNLAPKVASQLGINLVFYGENEAEYGNPIAENSDSIRKKVYYTIKNMRNIYLAGVKLKNLIHDYGFKLSDLKFFLPESFNNLKTKKLEIHYLGYYLKWVPQEAYYYAVNNCGFKPRPLRSQGTYSKYNSIDDKIDDLHYYTTFIKFGIGRATYDASQEVRNNHLTREEGKFLIKKYDGEFPDRYFNEILKHLDLNEKQFFKVVDKFRSPHIWKKIKNKWFLRHTVNRDGTDD